MTKLYLVTRRRKPVLRAFHPTKKLREKDESIALELLASDVESAIQAGKDLLDSFLTQRQSTFAAKKAKEWLWTAKEIDG